MSAMRMEGAINDHTRLIDTGYMGVAGAAAVYLITGAKTCLIDAGTRADAKRLVRKLKKLGAFPPDILIVTHSHYDHTQGIPVLRREASRTGKTIEVLASEKAIPLLADQSWNAVYGAGRYEGIHDVRPLRENSLIELGGVTLKVMEVPGHSVDHIAVLDQAARNVFVGDAIGDKIAERTFLPPFNPPSWDPDAFGASLKKLKALACDGVCFAHFGYVYGDEAREIFDEAEQVCRAWWELFVEYGSRLGETAFMRNLVLRELGPGVPELKIRSARLKALFGLVNAWRRVAGKPQLPVGLLLFSGVIKNLAAGYEAYHTQWAHSPH